MKKTILLSLFLFACLILTACGKNQLYVIYNDSPTNLYLETTVSSGSVLKKPKEITRIENEERPGYKFLGWLDEDGNGFDFTKKITDDYELESHWETLKFSIRYHTNMGTIEIPNLDIYTIDSKFILNPSLRTGYFFLGWYTEPTFENKVDCLTGHFSNYDLYARFETEFKIHVNFNTNGGSTIETQTLINTTNLAKPNDPTNPGYSFDGWYQDISLETTIDFDAPVTGDLTIYAKWNEKSFTISYVMPNNEEHLNPTSIYHTEEYTLVAPEYDSVNYTFDGWYNSPNFEGNSVKDLSKTTQDMTIYAKITPVQYIVTSPNKVLDTRVTYGGIFILPNYITPVGDAIIGWSLSSNGSNLMIPGFGLQILNYTFLYPIYNVSFVTVASEIELNAAIVNYNGIPIQITANFTLTAPVIIDKPIIIRGGTVTGTSIKTLTAPLGVDAFIIKSNGVIISDLTLKQSGENTLITIIDSSDVLLNKIRLTPHKGDGNHLMHLTNSNVNILSLRLDISGKIDSYIGVCENSSLTMNSIESITSASGSPIITLLNKQENDGSIKWNQDMTTGSIKKIINRVVDNNFAFLIAFEIIWDFDLFGTEHTPIATYVVKGELASAPDVSQMNFGTITKWATPHMVLPEDRWVSFNPTNPEVASKTYRAFWTFNDYQVTFDAYPFSSDFNKTFTVPYSTKIESFPYPSYKTFVVDGWYYDDEFINIYSFGNPITRDTQLFAKWIDTAIENNEVTATTLLLNAVSNMYKNNFTSVATGLIDTGGMGGIQDIEVTRRKKGDVIFHENNIKSGFTAGITTTYTDGTIYYQNSKNSTTTHSKDEFRDLFGVMPHELNYIITKHSVIYESDYNFDGQLYTFQVKLDTTTSTTNYVKQITTSSPITPSKDTTFEYITLNITLDINKNFIEISVNEKYNVFVMGTQVTTANITEKFDFYSEVNIVKPGWVN